MLVCDMCLQAIESHEGNQTSRKLDSDDYDKENDYGLVTCEWCEEEFKLSEMNEMY